MSARDRVLVNSLLLDSLTLSPAPWKSRATDDLQYSISYAEIAKACRKHLHSNNFGEVAFDAATLAEEAARYLLFHLEPPLKQEDVVEVQATLPDALLHGGKVVAKVTRELSDYNKASSASSTSPFSTLLYSSLNARKDSLTISDLLISTIIGLNDCERLEEQPLIVEVETWPNFEGIVEKHDSEDSRKTNMAWCAKSLQDVVWKHVRSNNPLLLETLCPSLASAIIHDLNTPKTRVRLDKPKAVMWTSTTAVEVVRHRNFFSSSQRARLPVASRQYSTQSKGATSPPVATGWGTSSNGTTDQHEHTAYIALGSNLGNRAENISRALAYLNAATSITSSSSTPTFTAMGASTSTDAIPNNLHANLVKVVGTSFLYESEPMYVLEQARFLNGVCKVSTSLSPTSLLALLKSIEHTVGRRKTIEKGPREIDLDILLYDDEVVLRDEEVDLTIPHPLIGEREFVLRPLADMAPNLLHPIHKRSISQLLADLAIERSSLRQVTPLTTTFSASASDTLTSSSSAATSTSTSPASTLQLSPTSRTLIMSILNVTPDSFSDGGQHNTLSTAIAAAREHIASGADIIDIGGVSTRPGSAHVTEAEELERVIPVIRGIREQVSREIVISVDTFRASVARAAIEAGANMINDISGGLHDSDMLATIAELDCPFVLMHMRGKPEEVNQAQHQKYEGDDVVAGVRQELASTVRLALAARIKRWNIILDPGIGFSKNAKGNVELLRHLPAITGRQPSQPSFSTLASTQSKQDPDSTLLANFPILLGVSRKGFLGKLTDQPDPTKREHANAAVHSLAIAQGVNILRVHDVAATRDVVRVTDAIYGRH